MSHADTHATAQVVDFDVDGMTCGSCAARIERVLGRQQGVARAEVNFAMGKARVELDPATVSEDDLRAAVDKIGYVLSRSGVRTLEFTVAGMTAAPARPGCSGCSPSRRASPMPR